MTMAVVAQISMPACTSPAITAALLVLPTAPTYMVLATPLLAGDATAQHQDHSMMMAVAAQMSMPAWPSPATTTALLVLPPAQT
jgi:uncharacterized lipoprotein YmbA